MANFDNNIINFKGISFYNWDFKKIINKIQKGGVLVAPAASALAKINQKKLYYNSLKNADIAILDSGLFCILLRVFKKKKVKKLSGYLFISKLLNYGPIKNKKILLVDPNIEESSLNYSLFKKKAFKNIYSYISPNYKKKGIKDLMLLNKIKKTKPEFVIINIGGEIQEPLGIYLKSNIKSKISIICTGAAIAFLTKKQAPINNTVDKFYLGWLWRIIFNPKKFFFRTLYSLSLFKLFI